MDSRTPLLTLRGIRKRFGHLEVLHGVDLDLCGGRGARARRARTARARARSSRSWPASTTTGRERSRSRAAHPCARAAPTRPPRLGIACIHQELALVGPMSVADNLFLGRERSRSLAAAWTTAPRRRRRAGWLERLGWRCDVSPAGRGAPRRRPAVDRDRPGPLDGRARARDGRAHERAHRDGDEAPLRADRAAEAGGSRGALHLAQDGGDLPDRRPHRRAAGRAARGHAAGLGAGAGRARGAGWRDGSSPSTCASARAATRPRLRVERPGGGGPGPPGPAAGRATCPSR